MHSTGKSSIEEQLAQYRLRKKREDSYKDVKKRFWELLCSAMSVMRGNSTASEAESSSSVDDQQPREHSDVKVNIVALNMSVCWSFYESVYLWMYISINLSVYVSFCVSMSFYLYIHSSVPVCASISISISFISLSLSILESLYKYVLKKL